MSETHWTKEEVLTLRRLVMRDVFPRFHGAVADAILDFGYDFTDAQRASVGSALLLTAAEGLCSIWGEARNLPGEQGYETEARALVGLLPCWLGICGHRKEASDASDASPDAAKDRDDESSRFADYATPVIEQVGYLLDKCIVEAPPSFNPEAVGISLFGALADYFNQRYELTRDMDRMTRFVTSLLHSLGATHVEMSARAID